jgi:hypothetical protein
MNYELQNAVKNNVLCYLITSRDSLTTDDIVSCAVAFYSDDDIKLAKDNIYGIFNEKPQVRVSCKSHPNPSVAHVADIITLLERKLKGKKSYFLIS